MAFTTLTYTTSTAEAAYQHAGMHPVAVSSTIGAPRSRSVSLLCLLALLVVLLPFAQAEGQIWHPSRQARQWADSVTATLSLEDQVAQLLVVRVPTKFTAKSQKRFDAFLSDHTVGGLCFFAGTASDEARQTVRYQALSSRLPLLITIDGEWGLGMRLRDCYSFPRQMMMGALTAVDDTLIYRVGEEIGRQCSAMGIHVNYAPDVDLNSNPKNPVIGARSFGEQWSRVARKGRLYVAGMQSQGIMAVAKHFPGHGDTDQDSHLSLPSVSHSLAYLDSVDTRPFRELIADGVMGMMVAHLQVDALDSIPTSLSSQTVHHWLRSELQFDGLVFTDGLDMKAISAAHRPGEAEVKALLAGADMLLLPADETKALHHLVKACRHNRRLEQAVGLHCRRVLAAKYDLGVAGKATLTTKPHAPSRVDSMRCVALSEEIAYRALTVVRGGNFSMPADDSKVLHITLSPNSIQTIDTVAVRRTQAVIIHLNAYANPSTNKEYGVSQAAVDAVGRIALANHNCLLVVYGSPYILSRWPADDTAHRVPTSIMVAYQNMPEVHRAVARRLKERSNPAGQLPVSVAGYAAGERHKLFVAPSSQAAADPYATLRSKGMRVECFLQIDSLVARGIAQHAMPGCQLLVAKDGEIVYNRCYGRLTYDAEAPVVVPSTIYDLASLTKMMATTLAVMKLVDNKQVAIGDRLSKYLPYLKHTDKRSITIAQAMSHCARLKAFDTYWRAVNDSCITQQEGRDYEACRACVLKQIAESKLEKQERYLYSDLGFILMADLVQQVSGQGVDLFVQQQFYDPMGLTSTTYCPLMHGMTRASIAPTEDSADRRPRLLQGEVHDPNAAAMGGVAGHAGLFSSATDLFTLCQMLLNGGEYAGRRYLSAQIIDLFNQQHFASRGNRRALGFDKPLRTPSQNTAPEVSQRSFGHTGFTGTMVWVDPQYNLVYIFLSNRVHPSSTNNKLSQLNLRTDIQSFIYQSFLTR